MPLQALNSTFYEQFKYTVRDMNVLSNITAKILKEFNASLAYQPAAAVRAFLTCLRLYCITSRRACCEPLTS